MSLRPGKKSASLQGAHGKVVSTIDSADPLADVAGPLPAKDDRIYVDNSNLAELQSTCNDAVERILTRPSQALQAAASGQSIEESVAPAGTSNLHHQQTLSRFKASHFHEDLRMILGYIAAFVIIGVSVWAFFIEKDWQKNRRPTAIAVIAYVILSAGQALDAYLQGDRIFVGKRKMLSKRIETEVLTVASRSLPEPSVSAEVEASTGRRSITPPTYILDVEYVRRPNGGKSLLRRSFKNFELGHLGEWFTREGEFIEAIFERRLLQALQRIIAPEETQQTPRD